MGCASCSQSERPTEAVDGCATEMDLQYGDNEESDATAISICIVDESNDPDADLAEVRHQAQRDLRGTTVGANGVELPEAAEPGVRAGCNAGEAMDRTRFSQASRAREKGARRCIFQRRERSAV